MKIKKGEIFSFKRENAPIDNLTISLDLKSKEGASIFSLGKSTDISVESYDHPTLVYILRGNGHFNDPKVKEGDLLFFKEGEYVGKKTEEGLAYLEIHLNKENTVMNENIKAGEVFELKDLLPYMEDKIVNTEIYKSDKSRLSLISMAKGTTLSPHKAPGEALLFILDGEGKITYEGKEYLVKTGDNFAFEKNGVHAVEAITNFKFALFLEF